MSDIRQAKKLAVSYQVSLDELIAYDVEVKEIQEMIQRTSEKVADKIDWTKMWAQKYPILVKYQAEVEVRQYSEKLKEMLGSLRKKYGYSQEDACLVLKDILGHCWNEKE